MKLLDARQGVFQLLDALRQAALQLHDAPAHLQPRAQFIAVKRLRDVIVGSGLQPLNNVLAAAEGGQQDDIDGQLSGVCARMIRQTSGPSFSGISQSSRAMSGRGPPSRIRKASAPSAAAQTSYPQLLQGCIQEAACNHVVIGNQNFHGLTS